MRSLAKILPWLWRWLLSQLPGRIVIYLQARFYDRKLCEHNPSFQLVKGGSLCQEEMEQAPWGKVQAVDVAWAGAVWAWAQAVGAWAEAARERAAVAFARVVANSYRISVEFPAIR